MMVIVFMLSCSTGELFTAAHDLSQRRLRRHQRAASAATAAAVQALLVVSEARVP